MADFIFLIDPETKHPEKIEPVSFSEINISERKDLEQWVIDHPELLGEEFLIITPEFDKFDKTKSRLDILALDSKGVLVVIELKLDAHRSLADQQAIRYAAFCSTMRMEDLVTVLAKRLQKEPEEAFAKIREFLEVDELPKLGNHPRIILAAGSLDDPELTSCVLWLRTFGVDISCVELTPYRLPKSPHIILVPRIIIPIPEAGDYPIKVELKEASDTRPIGNTYFDDIGNFTDDELKSKLEDTFDKQGLTPNFVKFLEILLSEDENKVFRRE